MPDKMSQIGEIVAVRLDTWDLPADCNEGELFTYAETLYDRSQAGENGYTTANGKQLSFLNDDVL